MPYLENTSAFVRVHHETLESRVMLAVDGICLATSGIQQLSLTSSGNGAAGQEGLSAIHDQLGLDGYGQTIAIIDSGIAYDHPALGGGFGTDYRVVGGWDFAENDYSPYDDAPAGFHGTHVAGIVGSSDTVNPGIAPRADMVGLRIFSDHGGAQVGWLEDALAWVHENKNSFEFPITTVNLSVGFVDDISEDAWNRINAQLSRLSEDGIFVAVAAGNDFRPSSPNELSTVGSSHFVFPVASVNSAGQLSHFSQRHDRVLAAPGEQIVSTAPDYIEDFNGKTDDFLSLTGTSMAAPFVAGASMLVRQAMAESGRTDFDQLDIYNHLRDTADDIFDAQTGNTYKRVNLFNAVNAIVSAPSPTPSPVPENPSDLGMIDFRRLEDQNLSHGSGYRLAAANEGILSFAVENHGISPSAIQVFDDQQNLLPVFGSSPGRIDVLVEEHATYTIQIQAALENVDLQITNLLSPSSALLQIHGTDRNDHTTVDIDGGLHVDVNGVHYSFSTIADQIVIDGNGGRDRLTITDPSARSAQLNSPNLTYVSADTQVAADGFEFVKLNTEQPVATAEIVGEHLAETITIDSESIEISSGQFVAQLSGFSDVTVRGRGGRDHVRYFDSAYDDRVVIRGQSLSIDNHQMSVDVVGIGKVSAFSKAGGDDSIEIFDSPQNDRLFVSPKILQFQGNVQILGSGFSSTVTHSQNGGRDEVRLFGSDFNDVFTASPSEAEMIGGGYHNLAIGFQKVMAYARAGNDRAELTDSPGNDKVVMKPGWSRLRGADYSNYVSQFDTVIVEAGDGVDQAFMHDSSSDDEFYASPSFARLSGESFYNLAKGFEKVQAFASVGQDHASLFDSLANDQFVASESTSWLTGDDFWNQVEGFDEIDVRGGRGRDVAYIQSLSADDLEQLSQRHIAIRRQDSIQSLWGFLEWTVSPDVDGLV